MIGLLSSHSVCRTEGWVWDTQLGPDFSVAVRAGRALWAKAWPCIAQLGKLRPTG